MLKYKWLILLLIVTSPLWVTGFISLLPLIVIVLYLIDRKLTVEVDIVTAVAFSLLVEGAWLWLLVTLIGRG
jgi:hypothetical protein